MQRTIVVVLCILLHYISHHTSITNGFQPIDLRLDLYYQVLVTVTIIIWHCFFDVFQQKRYIRHIDYTIAGNIYHFFLFFR